MQYLALQNYNKRWEIKKDMCFRSYIWCLIYKGTIFLYRRIKMILWPSCWYFASLAGRMPMCQLTRNDLVISLMIYYSFLYKMSWVKFWWILMQWSSEQLLISLRWYLQLVYIFSCQSLAFPWHQNILHVILYMLIFWNGVHITSDWLKPLRVLSMTLIELGSCGHFWISLIFFGIGLFIKKQENC